MHRIKEFLKHPLISGSTIVFAGSFLMGIGNYVYNLLMGRMLSVSDYGLLTSLSSLFILLGIFGSSFTSIFAKFSASYKGSDNQKGMQILFSYGFRFVSIFTAALLIILLLLIPFIESFLHVASVSYIILIIAGVVFSLLLTLPQGFLQGRMQFITLSVTNLSQPFIKIILALALLTLGIGVRAPLIAISFSVLLPGIFLYWYFYSIFRKKEVAGEVDREKLKKEFFRYTYTYFLAGIGIALMSNTDILLVRHYFNEVVSGQYAALSLMGKAIFYLVSPINFAFFPLIAYKKERKERLFGTVLLAFSIVTLASVALSFVYFAFPSLVLHIFFPSPEYQVLQGYLGLFSLYIFVFSLVTLLSNFLLSVNRTQIYKSSLFCAVVQILLIVLFHNSLYQVIGSIFFSSLLFFVILLGYYVKYERD
jgi:O-antigen/teichoic acid export membrane protein